MLASLSLGLLLFGAFITGLSAVSFAQLKSDVKSGRTQVRGVNLGGWLVAEHWMTIGSPAWIGVPLNVSNHGEYQTMKFLGHAEGDAQFKQHRDSFITEQDFRDIAEAKLNSLRIPVGYWIVGFDNSSGADTDTYKMFAPGALAYLDKAIRDWAPKHKLLVLVSMHAAKGSQNGGGHSAPIDYKRAHWSESEENVRNTLDVVEWLARRYKDDEAFLGIGLLNEPASSLNQTILKDYYKRAYARIRPVSDCLLVAEPPLAEQKPNSSDWSSFMLAPEFKNVMHEWHRYQIWGFKDYDENELITYANTTLFDDISSWTGNSLFIGEWSVTSSNASFKDESQLKEYARAQLRAFGRATGGWTYWTWKFYEDNEGSTKRNAWSMKDMIRRGILQF